MTIEHSRMNFRIKFKDLLYGKELKQLDVHAEIPLVSFNTNFLNSGCAL